MIRILEGQSIFDLAVQHCGDVRASFALALVNGISLTSELDLSVALTPTPILNKNVVRFFEVEKKQPATIQDNINNTEVVDQVSDEFPLTF
jgi:hypothetical protein